MRFSRILRAALPLLPTLLGAHMALAAGEGGGGSRTLNDDAGRSVTLPEAPQRVVVTHDALVGVPVMDIGAPVVGSFGRTDTGGSVSVVDFIDAVLGEEAMPQRPVGFGPGGQMDFEKLRALAPDVIIASEYDQAHLDRLAAIAPTYVQNIGTGRNHGFGSQQKLAQVLGLEAQLAARMEDYRARLHSTRAALPTPPEGQSYLAVIAHDDLRLVGEMSGVVQALEDLGYRRAEVSGLGASQGMGSNFAVPISPEVFMRLNPDVLILMNSYTGAERDAASIRAKLDRIAPGWNRFLRPESEGRTVYIDSAKVATPSVASAEHALDAIADWAEAR